MTTASQSNIDALKDIRKIMERSSRFISLSGWSGIAAGACALIGAWVANNQIDAFVEAGSACSECLTKQLILTASVVFVGAVISAVLFTYVKSRKDGTAIWGKTARRLLYNTLLPMLVGAAVIVKLIGAEYYDLIVPSSLIFYGLALLNGSKYTIGEVRYLGYAQIVTGVVALFIDASQVYAWAFGFGVLHIIYGVAMWWKHER